MKFIKFVLIGLILALTPFVSFAQDWVSYQSQQKINDLVETDTELIMATDAGLVVMNKSTLEKNIFTKANSNLTDNHIQTITEAPNGNIWIGTYDLRVAQFNGNSFVNASVPVGDYNPLTIEMYDLKVAPNGDIWVATTEGIFQKQGASWTQYDQTDLDPNLFHVWDMEINSAGEVFAASNYLYKFANGTWTNISDTTSILNYLHADLHFSNTGDLFMIGDLDKMGRFDGTNWEEFTLPISNGSEVVKITEDGNGDLYINTRWDGLYKLEGNSWVMQDNAQTQAFNNYSAYFHIDEQNRQWLNNNIHLSVSDNGVIQNTLIAPHTLENNGIKNFHKGANGHLYFITSGNDNFSVLAPDGSWSFFPMPATVTQFESIQDILVLSENDVWIATQNGLHHFDGTNWVFEDVASCKSFSYDSQGKIYVPAFGTIYIIENGVISELNQSNSPITSLSIGGLAIDANDNVWITERDPSLIHHVSNTGVWTTYNSMDHPAIDKPSGNFYFDLDGNMWVTKDNKFGVIKFDGTTFSNPIVDNIGEMTTAYTYSIAGDATGKLYFSHQYGVTTLFNGAWDDLLIEDVPQANSSFGSKILFDDAGTMWWASTRYGVFSYTPELVNTTSPFEEQEVKLSVYPNPARAYTILDFTLEESADVNYSIYNHLGQLIANQQLGSLSIGTYQEQISLDHLAKGFYLVQLNINNQSLTKKIIIQ